MQKSNKLDNYSGFGETLKPYLEKVYSIKPGLNGLFEDEYRNLLAKRVTIPLTQDSVYKTQFRNEQLRQAVPDITESTQFTLFDSQGNKVNSSRCGAELRPEYASIVCQTEVDIASVSVVLYCGPGANDLLLRDGSVTMNQDYKPTLPTDIAIKGYVDDAIEDFVSSNYPLKSLKVINPTPGLYYKDNLEYQVVYFEEVHNTYKGKSYIVETEPFAISNEFKEDTTLSLIVNGMPFFTEKVIDILEGNSNLWELKTTENIYATEVSKLYWNNSFRAILRPNNFKSWIDLKDPFLKLSLKVQDSGQHKRLSNVVTFGVDTYFNEPDKTPEINLEIIEPPENRSVYLSGVKYYPQDSELEFKLDLRFKVENTTLKYFRPSTPVILEILDKSGLVQSTYPISLDTHLPLNGHFEFLKTVRVNTNSDKVRVKLINLDLVVIYKEDFDLGIISNRGDESNRVTTPNSEIEFPQKDYGHTWDSTKQLEVWEPRLLDDVYTLPEEYKDLSAICFKVDPLDCYSHLEVDIEHNGKMYIKSEGNTGWLDCDKLFKPFQENKKDGTGCNINSGFYTFGKQTYKTPVFIRIVKATSIKFNSAILN